MRVSLEGRGVLRTLMAYEFDDPLAALMSSSARHSAMDLTFRKAESRVCGYVVGYENFRIFREVARLTPMVRRAID